MFTIQDLCERYDVSRETVLSWIEDGLMPAINVAPSGSKRRYYRVDERGISEFEAKRASKSAKKEVRPAKKVLVRQFV